MADENSFVPAPVELSSEIGVNNEIIPEAESIRYTQQQQIDHADKLERQNQLKQGSEALSLMNAATPTPRNKPLVASPPINETLSNLGKVEPAQVGDASIALDGKVAPAEAAPVTSIADSLPAPAPAPTAPAFDSAGYNEATRGQRMQIQASNSIADATIANAQANQAKLKVAEKAYADAEVERAKAKAQFDTDYAGKMMDYEQSIADYKQAAGDKVIPGKVMADLSTGQKIQSGIFMVLSAYGSALSGQESQALKVINNAINQDIEAQKFNIDNKLKGARMGVEGSQYLVSQMREKFKDDETATLATRGAMLQMVELQLKANASKLDENTAKPKALAFSGKLQEEMFAIKEKMKQAQAQAFMMKQLSLGDMTNLTDAQLTMMESMNKGTRERYVPGFGMATDDTQKKQFVEYKSTMQPAIDALQRIQEKVKQFNLLDKAAIWGTKRAELKAEVAALIGALRVPITGPGVLTPEEAKMIAKEVIGSPTDILSFPAARAATLLTTLNKIQGDVKSRGVDAGLPASSFKKFAAKTTFLD